MADKRPRQALPGAAFALLTNETRPRKLINIHAGRAGRLERCNDATYAVLSPEPASAANGTSSTYVRGSKTAALDQRERAVGEHGVVAVDREQLALPVTAGNRRGGLGGRVQAFHPAHDQPAADVVGGAPGDERGERHLGGGGVAGPAVGEVDRGHPPPG